MGLRTSQLCDTKEEAKRVKARLRLKLIEKARRRTRVNEGPGTLELLCDAYVADLETRGKAKDSIRGVKTTKKRLEWFFGQRMKEPLDLLTEADLFAFRAHYLEKGSRPSTINHDLLNIHTMLKLFAAGFPFPKRIFLPEDNTRVRYLQPDQKTRVMGFLQPPFREIAELAAQTLMRLTEVRRLRREQVSLAKGIVVPSYQDGSGYCGAQHGSPAVPSGPAGIARQPMGIPEPKDRRTVQPGPHQCEVARGGEEGGT